MTVEVLWLDSSVFPAKNDKAILNELQWIQYILDTQNTLQGAIDTLNNVRIEPIYAKVHYFVCDKQNHCATIEFVGGQTMIGGYIKNFEVITNSTYLESLSYLKRFKNFGGTQDIVWGTYNSLDRYARINELLRTYKNENPLEYSFKTLDSVYRNKVDIGSYTQWQIVYDKENLTSYFKTTFGNKKLGSVSLKSFPPHCGNRYYFDLDNAHRGNIESHFKPLSFEVNHAHVKKTLRKIMPHAPDDMIMAIAGAPFRFTCIQ